MCIQTYLQIRANSLNKIYNGTVTQDEITTIHTTLSALKVLTVGATFFTGYALAFSNRNTLLRITFSIISVISAKNTWAISKNIENLFAVKLIARLKQILGNTPNDKHNPSVQECTKEPWQNITAITLLENTYFMSYYFKAVEFFKKLISSNITSTTTTQ